MQHGRRVGWTDFTPFYQGDPIDFPVNLSLVSLRARVSSFACFWPVSGRWLPELDAGERCLVGMLLSQEQVYLAR